MKLFVIESKEETTVETQKNISMEVDISKLDDDYKSELLDELLKNMSDEDIKNSIDYNDRMLQVILKDHAYLPNKSILNMVYILEGDVPYKELEKDLMSLIEKYGLQDEL
jgi:hypothetical protein